MPRRDPQGGVRRLCWSGLTVFGVGWLAALSPAVGIR